MLSIVNHVSVMFCGGKRPYPIHNICDRALNRDHVYWWAQWASCNKTKQKKKHMKLRPDNLAKFLKQKVCNALSHVVKAYVIGRIRSSEWLNVRKSATINLINILLFKYKNIIFIQRFQNSKIMWFKITRSLPLEKTWPISSKRWRKIYLRVW